ncbi:MAG: hypothetical protein HY906_17445 [Deltaproteobacteria bacterium]|nr:hypothetical protein [Deltaproteobacteria bacterium]
MHRTFGCDVWRCPCGGQRRVVALVTRRRTAEELLRNVGVLDVAPPLPWAPGPPRLALLQERPRRAAAPGVDVGGLVCATSDDLPVSPSPFSPSAARPVRRRSRAAAPPRGLEPSIFLTFLTNGENLLLLRDRRVATSFAVEALRIFDHYHFRVAQLEAKAGKRALHLLRPPRKAGDTLASASAKRSGGSSPRPALLPTTMAKRVVSAVAAIGGRAARSAASISRARRDEDTAPLQPITAQARTRGPHSLSSGTRAQCRSSVAVNS